MVCMITVEGYSQCINRVKSKGMSVCRAEYFMLIAERHLYSRSSKRISKPRLSLAVAPCQFGGVLRLNPHSRDTEGLPTLWIPGMNICQPLHPSDTPPGVPLVRGTPGVYQPSGLPEGITLELQRSARELGVVVGSLSSLKGHASRFGGV